MLPYTHNPKPQPIPTEAFWLVLHAYPFYSGEPDEDDDLDYQTSWHDTEEEAHAAAEEAKGDAAAVYAYLGPGRTTLWALFDQVHGCVGRRYLLLFRSLDDIALWREEQKREDLSRYSQPVQISFGLGAPPIERRPGVSQP